jgi:hypothetical protein
VPLHPPVVQGYANDANAKNRKDSTQQRGAAANMEFIRRNIRRRRWCLRRSLHRSPPTVGKPRRRLDQVGDKPAIHSQLAVAANARRLNDPRNCWGRLAQFLPAQDIGRQIPRRRLSVSDRSLRHGRPSFRLRWRGRRVLRSRLNALRACRLRQYDTRRQSKGCKDHRTHRDAPPP